MKLSAEVNLLKSKNQKLEKKFDEDKKLYETVSFDTFSLFSMLILVFPAIGHAIKHFERHQGEKSVFGGRKR